MSNLCDSGNRREFNTGAVRDMAEGKGRMDLIPWNIAIKIRGYMHTHCHVVRDRGTIEELLERFSSIEWCLNSDRGHIYEDNFELTAAHWIMYRYFYNSPAKIVYDKLPNKKEDNCGSEVIPGDVIDSIWANAMVEVSKHFEDGANKYSENNWRKGIPVWCYFDSASRHLMKYFMLMDDEPHDRAVLWNLMCGAWTSNIQCGIENAVDPNPL